MLQPHKHVQVSFGKGKAVNLKAKPYFLEQTLLRNAAKAQDYIGGMQAYDKMIDMEEYSITVDDLSVAISMCCKAEHIPKALEIAEKIRGKTNKPLEAMMLGLIRCYSDAYQLRIVMQIIKKIPPADLKPRFFEPLLDAMKARGDFAAVLHLLQYMDSYNVPFREDQLYTILQLCSTEKGKQNIAADDALRSNVTAVLEYMSKHLVGMNTHFIRETVMLCNNQTLPQTEDDGVLVGTLSDIPGTISNFNADGTVTAINTTFLMDARHGLQVNISALLAGNHGVPTADTTSISTNEPNESSDANDAHENAPTLTPYADQMNMNISGWSADANCRLVTEKYRLASSIVNLNDKLYISDPSISIPSNSTLISAETDDVTTNTVPSPIPALSAPLPARIVDISHSNICPNCAGKMAPLPITDAERKLTLQTLLKRVGSTEAQYLEVSSCML